MGADGRPLSGAKLYTYETGTSTPKSVYTTAALSVAHANPVVADSAGRWPAMFLASGEYRTVLADSSGVVIATDDNVTGLESAGAGASGTIPVGSVMPYAGSSAPTGWLLAYGQAVSRTTYAGLFAVIGTTYGSGDGSSTFNLPDLRGRSVFGKDNMGGSAASRVTNGTSGITGTTLGAAGGDERLHQHTHSVTDGGHTHTGSTDSQGAHTHSVTFRGTSAANQSGGLGNSIGEESRSTDSQGAHTHTVTVNSNTTGITIANSGAGGSQNMPPAIVLNYIIFADA